MIKNNIQEGKFDPRNKLNDLTGKEWIKMTKIFLQHTVLFALSL